jgi:signal transduction histidine kinase
MSHTIKNILSGLQGGVYLVDSGLARNKQDRVAEGWAMVKRNVEKVSLLVQGVLYASKVREPEYKECDPGQLLSEVCDLFEEKAQSEGIILVRDFEKEMGLALLDPSGIHSALSNLLTNAVEACRSTPRDKRRITVSGRIVSVTLFLEVADNGSGIPEEVKERLFGKFYSTKGSSGTGLGLVLTKKIVEEHGGTITAESGAGTGTTFRIEIPLRTATEADAMEKAV